MPHTTLRNSAVIAIITATVVATGYAAKTPEPPSASPSGGARLRVMGHAVLTREEQAQFMRDYRGPDPADFEAGEGEVHEDDEVAARAAATLAATLPTGEPAGAGSAALESPAPLASWKALPASGGFPADAQIAVSTTHVVVTNRAAIAYFDKAGTLQGPPLGAKQFFSPLGLDSDTFAPVPITSYFDMRAIFDPYRKRFWVVALGTAADWKTLPPAFMRHVTAVAVSQTEDPTGDWNMYWWDAVSHYGIDDDVFDYGDVSDYPALGIDATLFHETHSVNNFDILHQKTFRYQRVSFHGADQMAAGLPAANIPSWEIWDLQNPDGTAPTKFVQPVVHHTASSRSFYVGRQGDDKLIVWSLTKPFQAGQKISATAVTMPQPWSSPLDAPQNTNVEFDHWIRMTNLGTNVVKAVFRNDLLYVVTNDALFPFTGVRYIRLLTNTYPAIVTDTAHKFMSRTFGFADALEGGGVAWAAWPAVEVNKGGNSAIAFARSSGELFPEARYSTHFAGESEMRLSRLLKNGEAIYHDGKTNSAESPSGAQPWGDTAGASVDPKDDTGIWIAQQYASFGMPTNYAIWVGKVFGKVYFDLLFSNVRVDSVDRIAGLVIGGRVHNGGDGIAPAGEISVSLVVGRTTIALGTLSQASLRPGEDRDFTATFPLPPTLAPGRYEVRATLVTSSTRDEYTAANNVGIASFEVR